jgi:hypothetical protein
MIQAGDPLTKTTPIANMQDSLKTFTIPAEITPLYFHKKGVHADVAETSLPIANVAMPRTKIAMRFAAGLGFPPARFMQVCGFLQNLQVWHDVSSST